MLDLSHVDAIRCRVVVELVRHDDEVAFHGIFVCLELVVYGLMTRTSGEEEQQFGGCVRVVCGFGDVAVDAAKLGDLS